MAISTDLFNGVDLSRLPAPEVVKQLDYNDIRTSALADLVTIFPEFSALTSADPAVKVLELFCYREILIRSQTNQQSLDNMLAFATGSDLDHIAVRVNLERFILNEGDPLRGIEALLENDEDFRARIVRAPEGFSVAGPIGAYVNLATDAHADVRFASAISPAPSDILVTIQSRVGNGTASAEVIEAVRQYLNDENRRPLGDRLTVQSAQIKEFSVIANIKTFGGASSDLVLIAARTRLLSWLADNQRLERDITIDAIHAQLRVEGASLVTLDGWQDIICGPTEAAYCTQISINHIGIGE